MLTASAIQFSAIVACTCVTARLVQFSYMGCYVDSSNRDISGLQGISKLGEFAIGSGWVQWNNMTRELCATVCSLGGFKYFGLQFAHSCMCGDAFGSYGIGSASSCNMTCTGAAQQVCGGFWRNSVFQLAYPENNFFSNSAKPTKTVQTTQQSFWTVPATFIAQCLAQCEAKPADCQAVIFSSQQQLCHLLRFAYPPASLSSSAGDYYIRR